MCEKQLITLTIHLHLTIVKEKMKKIIIARHGECDMNLVLKSKIGGQSNSSALTGLGIQQAEALGQHLARLQALKGQPIVSKVYSSTAVRARDTAIIVLQALGRRPSELITTEQLLELDQGQWEGAERAACYTPERQAEISKDPHHFRPPGGESPADVEARVRKYIDEVVLPSCEPGAPPALVVGHGFATKCLLRSILESAPHMTRNVHIDNTAIVEIACRPKGTPDSKSRVADRDTWYIMRVNDTNHLMRPELLQAQIENQAVLMGT